VNKREGKKKHTGIYQEFGFSIGIQFVSSCSQEDMDNFLDQFLDIIESNRMDCGGGGNFALKTCEFFITSTVPRGNSPRLFLSVTHEQRQAIIEWCRGRSEIYKLKSGELVDAWNVPEAVINRAFDTFMQDAETINETI